MTRRIVYSVTLYYLAAGVVGFVASTLFPPLPAYITELLLVAPLFAGVVNAVLGHAGKEPAPL